jgi:uncharacterized protein
LTIVSDTNVVVSALLRRAGPPGKILDLVLARQVTLALDHRIFIEYREVLHRLEFNFPPDLLRDLLDFVWRYSVRVDPAPLAIGSPDPDDAKFIEVAVTSKVSVLVTGNLKHFPLDQRHGVRVMTPREWLDLWAGER